MIKIFLTGAPGIGKTTCVLKIYETLTIYKYKVGGFISREIREGGVRVGFKMINLQDGSEGILADIHSRTPYKIGKYYVKLDELNRFVEEMYPIEDYDVMIIDEIGPMEMISNKFKKLINDVLTSEIPAILTIHVNYASKIQKYFKTSRPNILYKLTRENRDGMPLIIWRDLQRYIKRRGDE